MIKDFHRTETYRRAIMNNKHLFKDKIVLDIGCGTGILSLFASKAGAKHVYGIDFASIATYAQQTMKMNGLDSKITIIRGKVEEVQLPVQKVDIIISEWMGYFLLYEGMLDCVIYARDKWLVPGGLMYPDKAVMHIAAFEDKTYVEEKSEFWDSVYGFRMNSMKELAFREPLVDVINRNALISKSAPILELDLKTCTVKDLEFASSF
jgi:type I protein arginine methyltransferase